jgi:hypothetical protein
MRQLCTPCRHVRLSHLPAPARPADAGHSDLPPVNQPGGSSSRGSSARGSSGRAGRRGRDGAAAAAERGKHAAWRHPAGCQVSGAAPLYGSGQVARDSERLAAAAASLPSMLKPHLAASPLPASSVSLTHTHTHTSHPSPAGRAPLRAPSAPACASTPTTASGSRCSASCCGPASRSRGRCAARRRGRWRWTWTRSHSTECLSSWRPWPWGAQPPPLACTSAPRCWRRRSTWACARWRCVLLHTAGTGYCTAGAGCRTAGAGCRTDHVLCGMLSGRRQRLDVLQVFCPGAPCQSRAQRARLDTHRQPSAARSTDYTAGTCPAGVLPGADGRVCHPPAPLQL